MPCFKNWGLETNRILIFALDSLVLPYASKQNYVAFRIDMFCTGISKTNKKKNRKESIALRISEY